MEIKGKIIEVLDIKSGTSKNGKEWKSLEFIFESIEIHTQLLRGYSISPPVKSSKCDNLQYSIFLMQAQSSYGNLQGIDHLRGGIRASP